MLTFYIIFQVSSDTVKNDAFKSRIHKLVWNTYIDSHEFIWRWSIMLDEFSLRNNKLLDDMYNIRYYWISAYFRHIPMCGLMKTTSRSESSISFFNEFVNNKSLLVNFMLNFDTAISKQRHAQLKIDVKSNNTNPKMIFVIDHLQI